MENIWTFKNIIRQRTDIHLQHTYDNMPLYGRMRGRKFNYTVYVHEPYVP